MKKIIRYYSIENGVSTFKDVMIDRTQKYHHFELVTADSEDDLQAYIENQTDECGNHFIKSTFGEFDYISAFGAIKISDYKEPEFLDISATC